MQHFKSRIRQLAEQYLQRAGVPQMQITTQLKKTGGWLILGSSLLIVPLLIFEHMPLAGKILLQLGYAGMMCVGVILAFEEENPS
ncbi:hypothetical protein [Superficieibacter sp. 1612_C1]|jgi:hypothetical protein|uniref:hypothetical protein n=1 Tax=Superficieibacter sp. 1612_C1 TaxID=2780382 RepID=UPI001883375C|nr:hypothetical protein [Superficieibacter sp. 1612_C1]